MAVKKLNTLYFLLASIAFISSCQKQPYEALDPVTIADNRVKTYTETVTSPNFNSTNTFNVTYDNSGRVTSLIDNASPGDKFVYTYPTANRYTMDIYNGGVVVIHEDFFLNANLLVDSTIQYNDTKDTLTEGYSYNASNQMTRIRRYDYTKATGAVLFSTVTNTYGADGNLTKSESSDGETNQYEYYPNLVYAPPIIIGPVTNLSTKKLNLVKKQTISYNGSVYATLAFTHTFDSKDRISTEKVVASDGSTVVKTFTY